MCSASVSASITRLALLTPLNRRQEKFATDLFRALSSGDLEEIAEGYRKIPSDARLLIFNVPDDSESLTSKFAYVSFLGCGPKCSEEYHYAVRCRNHIPAKGGWCNSL